MSTLLLRDAYYEKPEEGHEEVPVDTELDLDEIDVIETRYYSSDLRVKLKTGRVILCQEVESV